METPKFTNYLPDLGNLPPQVGVLGSGEIGGKAKGLFFVAELMGTFFWKEINFCELIEIPETIVIATDVFEEFLEKNRLKYHVKDLEFFQLQEKFLQGEFNPEIKEELKKLLLRMNYPLAIRSSSFLEDNLQYSFAGIYSTLFLPNFGSLEQRLDALERAIKKVYASTYNPNAKAYRIKHLLKWKDEKMAVIIQRMIGQKTENLFYPLFAGVAFSKNFYPWAERIKMEDGVIRLVFGLGTRAVGRHYGRVFSPSAPGIRPEGSMARMIMKYSQERFDALNLETGELVVSDINSAKLVHPEVYKVASLLQNNDFFTSSPVFPKKEDHLVLTFAPIIESTNLSPFVPLITSLLKNLEKHYHIPIDIEFACDSKSEKGKEKEIFYLLQCRPLGARQEQHQVEFPTVPKEKIIFSGKNVLGNGVKNQIKYLIYVNPDKYLLCPPFEIVALIDRLNQSLKNESYILIGPGRWGTTNPQLGIPVSYAHISGASVIVELSYGQFAPEFSYGTHFFGDLLADKVFYLPVFPEKGDIFNKVWIEDQRNFCDSEVVKLIEWEEGLNAIFDGLAYRGMVYF